MSFQVVFHAAATAELEALYVHLRGVAGAERAGAYVESLYDFIEELGAFPQRGTVRDSVVPALRIIGFRRRISIAFTVDADTLLILGVFTSGRNVGVELLEARL